ncbi:TSCPD domain-containing protein [Clostridia bacterium]|nr:TSCPD domain-containing protein [Clostridia bacterium]
MTYEFKPRGVCAQKMIFSVEDGIVKELEIIGGCSGNGKGIAALVRGERIEDVIDRLSGIRCGSRPSSCPAQFAEALRQAT